MSFSEKIENNLPPLADKCAQNRAAAKRIPRFLEEFYQILEKGNCKEYIDWNNEGTSILIKDPNQFAEKVLPVYFKHNNLASFIRQLNMYDFKKQKHPHYNYVFSHEFFRRDQKGLLKNILRKSSSEYLRYQEKKRRKEEAARMLAQSSARIKDPESVYMENNILKHNQRQLEVEIHKLNQQISQYRAINANFLEKYDSLKQEGVYLIKMINALTEKLGEETIFSIIQSQMYGTEHHKQETQPVPTTRAFPANENIAHDHACATAETSSGNYDHLLCDGGKQCRCQIGSQGLWDLEQINKKVKSEPHKQASQIQQDQNTKAQALRQTENFTEPQSNFANFHDEKDLDLKGVRSEF